MNPSFALLQNLASQNNVFYVPDNSYSYYMKTSTGMSRNLPPMFSYYANTGPVISTSNPNKPTLSGTITLAGGPNPSAFTTVINASLFDSLGNYYIAGNFLMVDGIYCSGIAKWNGSAWSGVGNGFNGAVNALTVDSNGNLYAGGEFTSSSNGATALLALAKLPVGANAWISVGSLARSNPLLSNASLSNAYTTFTSAVVNDLTSDSNGNVYIAGTFLWVNLSQASCLATLTPCGGLSPLLGSSIWSNTSGTTVAGFTLFTANPVALQFDSAHNILFVGGNFFYNDSSAAINRARLMAVNLAGLTPTVITIGQNSITAMTQNISDLALACGNLYMIGNANFTASPLGYINLMSSLSTISDVADSQGRVIANDINRIETTAQGLAVGGDFTTTSVGTSTAIVLQHFALFNNNAWVAPAGLNNVNAAYPITSIAVDPLGLIAIASDNITGSATNDHCNILKQYTDYVKVNYGAVTLATLVENGETVLVYATKDPVTGLYFVQSSNASNGEPSVVVQNYV